MFLGAEFSFGSIGGFRRLIFPGTIIQNTLYKILKLFRNFPAKSALIARELCGGPKRIGRTTYCDGFSLPATQTAHIV